MMEYEPGCLARSLAGHDKGQLYVILKTVGEYVYLTDGNKRAINNPKRKRKKHVQLQGSQQGITAGKLKQAEPVSNEEIRTYLKVKSSFSNKEE